LSHERAKDVTSKFSKVSQITGILSHVLQYQNPEASQTTNINTLAIPTILYFSETLTLKERVKSRIATTELKFLGEAQNTRCLTKKDVKQL
jgi:hypothetical protein